MAVDKRDDILRLAKGKASIKRIGSRSVAHRLNKHEWERLEIALRKGYLKVKKSDRSSLVNVYEELMEASGSKPIIKHE